MKPDRFLTGFAATFLTLWAAVAASPLPAQQAYIKASNTGTNDRFGFSVALSGDTMVIGAQQETSNATGVNGDQSDNSARDAGAVYVFVRKGTNWIQEAYIKASNTDVADFFGQSVGISENTMVVGAPFEDSNAVGVNSDQSDNSAARAGAAYVFVRSGTNWTQQAYLKASNTRAGDQFGWAVSNFGDTIVVGAYLEDSGATGVNGDQNNNSTTDSGAAYVFVRSGSNWIQEAYLKASNPGTNDDFGARVSVSGNTTVIGAPNEDSNAIGVDNDQSNNAAPNSGAAYVFVRQGTNWSQQAYLKASNTEAGDQFGGSLALWDDTLLIGAALEDSNGTGTNSNQGDNSASNSGAAYILVRNGTNWSQQAYLKASNTGVGDNFGLGVGIFNDTVVIGAYLEDSNATGVNGAQSDNTARDAGAAYVFERRGTNWFQEAYLKASNSGDNDRFGLSVAVAEHTVVVGAYWEDGNATGINGDQSDNTVSDAGAAYVFTDLGLGPQLTIVPDGAGGYLIRLDGIAGFSYQLQRAATVTGPWNTNTTITPISPGVIEFRDTNPPPGQGFYRVVR